MNALKTSFTRIMLVAAIVITPATGMAAQHENHDKGDKTQHDKGGKSVSAADVREEAGETYATLKQYTLQQKDKAADLARKRLDHLDDRLEKVERNIQSRWDGMNQAAREHYRDVLKSLREQRNEVAEWYGGIRHSSSAAWEDVKKGFSESYDRLESSFEKASKEFEKEKDK